MNEVLVARLSSLGPSSVYAKGLMDRKSISLVSVCL